MSSPTIPQGLFGEFARNQRLVVGAIITFTHASIVIAILFENPSEWQSFLYASLPTLITIVVPFLVTSTVLSRWYKKDGLESHLQTLSKGTGELPEAREVELPEDLLEQLPEELSEPDSVKVIDEELLEHVDGEEFDPVDADARGIVAIGFASLLIIPSAPTVGYLLGGVLPIIVGVVIALFAAGLVLQQHRDMVELIEYTPYTI